MKTRIQLTPVERDLLIGISEIGSEMAKKLQGAPLTRGMIAFEVDARDLDVLLGMIASEAGLAEHKSSQKELEALFIRLSEFVNVGPGKNTAPSIEDVQQIVRRVEKTHNTTPLDDFCGLSPEQMHHLIYEPYGERSPITLKKDISDSTLDDIPFFRLTEELLKIIRRDEFIKLTPLGALPRKYLHELYDHRFIPEDFIDKGISKLAREIDSVSITSVHLTIELSGLTRKIHGKLVLTKSGTTLLQPEKRSDLFHHILHAFTNRFNWGYNDVYTDKGLGQEGWGYSIYLLHKFGAKPEPIRFYATKYRTAFPFILQYFKEGPYSPAEEMTIRCYAVRVIERFLEWYGFANVGPSTILDRENAIVTKSRIFSKIWKV